VRGGQWLPDIRPSHHLPIDAAAYCERRAAAATDPDIKSLFEETAQRWRQLAKHIEQLERESDRG
jgi:hypothetical protein